MPLIKRSSKAARAVNVRRLIDEGYPPRQAVAIAYSTQRAAKAKNRAGKPPKAPRPPAGTPTSGDLYVLHTELEDHEKRNGQPQPLNAFGATSMGAIRKMLKAGYLAPAIGYPRGYWVTTGLADSALHEWRLRHAGVYGIPANYGQNAAGGKRRNRAGVDVDTLARIARHARSVMREQFDGWVSLGKLRDPIGHAQVIRWLMERQADRTDAGYKRNAERFGEREAAFRKGMADEAHDLISEITIKLDPVYVASLKKSNKAGGKRRGARR